MQVTKSILYQEYELVPNCLICQVNSLYKKHSTLLLQVLWEQLLYDKIEIETYIQMLNRAVIDSVLIIFSLQT